MTLIHSHPRINYTKHDYTRGQLVKHSTLRILDPMLISSIYPFGKAAEVLAESSPSPRAALEQQQPNDDVDDATHLIRD